MKEIQKNISSKGKQNVPSHSTGGAIEKGNPLDMGIPLDDPYNEDFIHADSPRISSEARKNRDIMTHALVAVGFVGYSAEFWHFSYGDRRWAFLTHSPYSIYGPIDEER